MLINDSDNDTMVDALWALSYLTDGENYKIQAIIGSGCVRRLVELLSHPSPAVQLPAIRAVGNIVTGTDVQTQAVLDCGALPRFGNLLCSPKDNIRKEACWAISNVTAGTQQQVQAVIDNNLVPPLLQCLANADFRAKREAAWAVSNFTTSGSLNQVAYLVQQGCIPPLVALLSVQDVNLLMVVLDALSHILAVGQNVPNANGNPCADYVEEAGGIDAIEALQEHENEEVYLKALKIIETYFMDDQDGNNNLAAPQSTGDAYSFAIVPVANQAVGFSF
jgi:hypothetical protein